MATEYRDMATLTDGLDEIRASPRDEGSVAMVVIRPAENLREEVDACEVSAYRGMHGDRWEKGRQKYGPDNQIALMNSRVIQLVAGNRARWSMAGDNLFVDLDLSAENLSAGDRLEIGSALLEVTAVPHQGCKKFVRRYGEDAVRFVNTGVGKDLHLRGIYAKVIRPGTISKGDTIRVTRQPRD